MARRVRNEAEMPDLFGRDIRRERRTAAAITTWCRRWERGGIAAAMPKGPDYRDAGRPPCERTAAADWIGSHPGGAVTSVSQAWLDRVPGLGDLVVLCNGPLPNGRNQEVRCVIEIQEDLFGLHRFLMLGPVLARRSWPRDLRAAIPAERAPDPRRAGLRRRKASAPA